jgi:hypothetical protein
MCRMDHELLMVDDNLVSLYAIACLLRGATTGA